MNGSYCCKTREEKLVTVGITPQNEIDDGTCDGLDFNRQSVCCADGAHTPCPHSSGCFDNYDGKGKYLIHLCSIIHFSCVLINWPVYVSFILFATNQNILFCNI